jgi:O-antigen/teichoic acid export membrane protein
MSIIPPETISRIKEKWAHAGFQKYLQNTSWMFFGQLSMIISLVINIWLARYLGPEKFGIISYVFAFVGIFSFIANMGISDILIRELVKNPHKRDELLGTASYLLSIGGVTSFLICSISAVLFETSPLTRVLIILYSLTSILSAVNVISSYFQATVQSKRNAIAQIIITTAISALKIFFILTGKGIIWIVFAFTLDYIIGTAIYILNYLLSGLKISQWTFNKEIAKTFLSASAYLTLSAVTGYLLLKIDQVMIKFYLTETSVGLYAVAVKLSEVWYFIPGIICSSIFPAIINAKKVHEEMYSRRLRNLYIFLASTALLIAIPVAILAPWIIKLLYGITYIASTPILQIYVWSGIGLFLSVGINKYFLTENYLKSILIFNSVAVIINIILNIILIPRIGLTGAAWATLISYSIGPTIILLTNRFPSIKKFYER